MGSSINKNCADEIYHTNTQSLFVSDTPCYKQAPLAKSITSLTHWFVYQLNVNSPAGKKCSGDLFQIEL